MNFLFFKNSHLYRIILLHNYELFSMFTTKFLRIKGSFKPNFKN